MQKQVLEVGRRYRGSGWVNEYGELHFRPEQKGTKPQNMHLVFEENDVTLCESTNYFKVTIKFDKKTYSTQSATAKFLYILVQLKNYIKL